MYSLLLAWRTKALLKAVKAGINGKQPAGASAVGRLGDSGQEEYYLNTRQKELKTGAHERR
ncbi:MAG: hypothetical protein P0Y53_11745 [Candidatus Pseudobacter hemicellulosilyticus]|uniref:Uncharacterized protein n=1 Tax=Candidatus Pseudobacter hemicellulosilyticus TaxID=3121375 RepID=A0AAJ5WVH5_9BACT|nr:MAG: hypothetical protein P0Y53_11745 [Pseudobacter sp.]